MIARSGFQNAAPLIPPVFGHAQAKAIEDADNTFRSASTSQEVNLAENRTLSALRKIESSQPELISSQLWTILEDAPSSLRPLTDEERARLEEIYGKYPALKEALRKSGVPEEKWRDIFPLTAAGDTDHFALLPEVIEAFQGRGWRLDRWIELLGLLVEKADRQRDTAVYTYHALTELIPLLSELGGKEDQQFSLLTRLAKRIGNRQVDQLYLTLLSGVLEGFKGSGWSFEELSQLILLSVETAKLYYAGILSQIAPLIPLLARFGRTQEWQSRFFTLLLKRFRGDQDPFNFAGAFLPHLSEEHLERACALILRLRGFELLRKESRIGQIGVEASLKNLEFFASLFEQWPKEGGALLEGIFAAVNEGIIPADLTEMRDAVASFIQKAHSFNPALYRAYQKEGEPLFERVRSFTDAILRDEFGLSEVAAVKERDGPEFLVALTELVMPPSGKNYLKDLKPVQLMEQTLEPGDLRDHLPEDWKGRLAHFSITRGGRELRDGAVFDPEGEIEELLMKFQGQGDFMEGLTELGPPLKRYLESGRGRSDQEKILGHLLPYAAKRTDFRERIGKIRQDPYRLLSFLEEYFTDPDQLPKALSVLFHQARKGFLKGRGEMPPIRREEFVQGLLEQAILLIQRERAKYRYREQGEIWVGLRAVKGPAFGLWGRNAEVCIVIDVELWKDPQFVPLAILASDFIPSDSDQGKKEGIDESQLKQVVGFIGTYQATLDGKRCLTLPGIDPSPGFLEQVDPQILYEGLIRKVIVFAEEGGFHGVYIPVTEHIHSNRPDIQKAIQRAHYMTKKIAPVNWNTRPKSYPFDEVFAVWER